MSMYGCCAIDSSWPLKLQYTWLSGYWPLVWLTMATSTTLLAAGIALVLPQNEAGGSPEPVVPPPPPVVPPAVVETPNSHSEYPYWVARAVPYIRTYRPVPLTLRVWVPPVPLVVEEIVVQFLPSAAG